MIYQYDLALPLPTKDIYDTLIMQMAVAAAKDMYDRGEKRIDEFYDKYGDFYSPIAGATEDVYNTGVGRIKNIISDLYSKGIDPLRSVEGRAVVALAIRETDIARINARKQEAELAKQYIKNRDIAIMNGTYNPDVERAINGGKLLEEWTAKDGYWKSTAPVKYMTQDEIISPLAKVMTPEFDAVRTALENNGYDYKTVSEDRIRQMVNDNLDDLIGKSTIGKYYYDNALKLAKGDEKLARQILAELYTQAAKKHTKEDREINQYKYQQMIADERRKANREEAAMRMQQMREEMALRYHYRDLENFDFNGDGKLDADELKYKEEYKKAQINKLNNTGRRSNDGYPNIFDEADRKPNTYIDYVKLNGYENKISPASGKIVSDGTVTDEKGKLLNKSYIYTIKAADMKELINSGYITSQEEGKKLKGGEISTDAGDIKFVADGFIIKRNGRYYMKGKLQQKSGGKEIIPKNAKTSSVLVLINERDANYAEQQKKDKSVDTEG